MEAYLKKIFDETHTMGKKADQMETVGGNSDCAFWSSTSALLWVWAPVILAVTLSDCNCKGAHEVLS